MEVKIDETIYKANVVETKDYKDLYYGVGDLVCESQLPEEAIEPLKSAEKVALRYHRENGYRDVVELPDDVLAEWKEVINTTE